MSIPDEMVTAMRTYLGSLHADSTDTAGESSRKFLALRETGAYQGLDVLLGSRHECHMRSVVRPAISAVTGSSSPASSSRYASICTWLRSRSSCTAAQ